MNQSETDLWIGQIKEMYSEGASDAEVAAALEVPLARFYSQMESNEAFRTLVTYGRTLSQAWWERQARKNIHSKQFNTPLWTFYMKNKFGWAERTENTNNNENLNTDLDSLKQQVMDQIKKFTKKNMPELTDARLLLEGMDGDGQAH